MSKVINTDDDDYEKDDCVNMDDDNEMENGSLCHRCILLVQEPTLVLYIYLGKES